MPENHTEHSRPPPAKNWSRAPYFYSFSCCLACIYPRCVLERLSPPTPTAYSPHLSPPGQGNWSGDRYNAMIAPFAAGPTQLAGMVWYQGESNNGQGRYYEAAFPAMPCTSQEASWKTLRPVATVLL